MFPVPEAKEDEKEKIIRITNHMLDLHKKIDEVKTPHEKTALQRQIDEIDKQIDRLVYKLYDLTEEEIAIVERESDDN